MFSRDPPKEKAALLVIWNTRSVVGVNLYELAAYLLLVFLAAMVAFVSFISHDTFGVRKL